MTTTTPGSASSVARPHTAARQGEDMTTPNTTPAGAAIEPLWTERRIMDELMARFAKDSRAITLYRALLPFIVEIIDAYEAEHRRTASAHHEQLQRLLGEYQDLYLEAQRQRDALAAKVAELDAEAAFWNNHYNAAVEEQRELEMVIERLRAQPLTEAERDDLLLDADNAMRQRAMQRARDTQSATAQESSEDG